MVVAKRGLAVMRHRAVVVAVTKQGKSTAVLNALTFAALALPGLSPAADEDSVDFQYTHYQEGQRNLNGNTSTFAPIEVDSVHGSAKVSLTDRIRFAFNYTQDTWSGATPIATAPEAFGGNGHYYSPNDAPATVTGATPFLVGSVFFDANRNVINPIYGLDPLTSNTRLVHTLSMASPETRKQGDFKLGYAWDEAALDIGGGVSVEDDYQSSFANINTRWDFNQKQTSLNLGLSYTSSDTRATFDHDAMPYVDIRRTDYNLRHHDSRIVLDSANFGKNTLYGERQDWSSSLGLVQILNKNAVLEAGLDYTHSSGYMANPYKVVEIAFINPDQSNCEPDVVAIGGYCGDMSAHLEERPDQRNQWSGHLGFVQHIAALDAAVHTKYRLSADDWGVTAHTFEADWVQPIGQGWTVTPRVRYYSQDAASFYTPFIVSQQGYTSKVIDPNKGQVYIDGNNPDNGQAYYDDAAGQFVADGDVIGINPYTGNALLDANGNPVSQAIANTLIQKSLPFDRAKLPAHYSSDQRLSGYGAISGGVTLSKQFAKGITLDLGFEYYSHQGSLKLGGGGEAAYADFNYWLANASVNVNLSTLALGGSDNSGHSHNHRHASAVPAGVMFGHMLDKAGDMMLGYRYMYAKQSGAMLDGSQFVSDAALVAAGCGPNPCFLAPKSMAMHMHMLDLMYAPTDWLTLMLMPQFVDMSMSMQKLDGLPDGASPNNNVGAAVDEYGNVLDVAQHIPHHIVNGHENGGIGDLGMYAMVKLFDDPIHHLHVTAGLSAPTASIDSKIRKNHGVEGGYLHYGMQLGSGTWDFKPSATYTGQSNDWSWGAQTAGTFRMESANPSGYALGDLYQVTAWGGYGITPWLQASVRGVYTVQAAIDGAFNGQINQFGPMDYPGNYGGRYWDVGFGVSALIPSGSLAGNRLSVEWLQPVTDDVNGFQLQREGALSASWSASF